MDSPGLDRYGEVSVARWEQQLRLAEVLVKKGKLWSSMGVVRNSKLCFHLEEAIFMVEQNSLVLLLGDTPIPRRDVYSLLTVPENGCSWDAFQVFCHLKKLGYIIGRYNVPWSSSSKQRRQQPQTLDKPVERVCDIGSEYEIRRCRGAVACRPSCTEHNDVSDVDFIHRSKEPVSELLPSAGRGDADEVVDGSTRICMGMRMNFEGKETETEGINAGVQGTVVGIPDSGEESEAFPAFARDRDAAHEVFGTISENPAGEVRSREDGAIGLGLTVDSDNCVQSLSSGLSSFGLNENFSNDVSLRGAEESGCSPMFDVHQPISRFKKTDPDGPIFSLCVVGRQPLEQKQVCELQQKAADRPLKFGSVVGGHVFVFSFTSCSLTALP